MSTAELKLELFRKIDSMDQENLEKLYQYFLSMVHVEKESDEWEQLSENQKAAILTGVEELEKGYGINHEDVMKKYKQKYSHE